MHKIAELLSEKDMLPDNLHKQNEKSFQYYFLNKSEWVPVLSKVISLLQTSVNYKKLHKINLTKK